MAGTVTRGIGSLVEPGLAQLAGRCLELLQAEGLLRLWRELGRFEPGEFLEACARRLGYAVSSGNRGRMLRVLLDVGAEAGWLRREGPLLRSGEVGAFGGADATRSSGELSFFCACLDAAPAYLRGETDGIAFDAQAETLWDAFLASPLYSFGRRWLLQKAGLPDGPSLRCLDLAFGTGQSTVALCRQFPSAFKAAVDTHGRYQPGAARRAARVLAGGGKGRATGVAWVPPSLWARGFDADLPFADATFDLVFFACGDPYVGPRRRPAFYREVARVLRPGGRLALLTWQYPEGELPAGAPVRLRALLHDFAESVCAGWHGFLPAPTLAACLASAGFRPTSALGGSLWGLEGAAWLAGRR